MMPIFLNFNFLLFFFRIKSEIENLHARNKLMENYEICQKKVTWMQFEELYIKYKETEEDLKKAQA